MGYRAKRKVGEPGKQSAVWGRLFSELDFCLRPIHHLGACTQASQKSSLQFDGITKFMFLFDHVSEDLAQSSFTSRNLPCSMKILGIGESLWFAGTNFCGSR